MHIYKYELFCTKQNDVMKNFAVMMDTVIKRFHCIIEQKVPDQCRDA